MVNNDKPIKFGKIIDIFSWHSPTKQTDVCSAFGLVDHQITDFTKVVLTSSEHSTGKILALTKKALISSLVKIRYLN